MNSNDTSSKVDVQPKDNANWLHNLQKNHFANRSRYRIESRLCKFQNNVIHLACVLKSMRSHSPHCTTKFNSGQNMGDILLNLCVYLPCCRFSRGTQIHTLPSYERLILPLSLGGSVSFPTAHTQRRFAWGSNCTDATGKVRKLFTVFVGISLEYHIIWKHDSAWREQFLVPLPLYHPVFTIVIYGW